MSSLLIIAIFIAMSITLIVTAIVVKNAFKKVQVKFNTLNTAELFLYDEIKPTKRHFGEGAVYTFVSNPHIPKQAKLKAFLVASELKTSNTIKLLKLGLKEKDDEIRLICFGAINNIEKSLNDYIYQYEQKYKQEKKLEYLKRLAKTYWEMIYLNIADEEYKVYLLNKIESLIKKYLQEKRDFDMEFLLSKVYIQTQRYNEAYEILKNYQHKREAIPFLIEIYYYKKEFSKIKELIIQNPELKYSEKFQNIYRLWTDEKAS